MIVFENETIIFCHMNLRKSIISTSDYKKNEANQQIELFDTQNCSLGVGNSSAQAWTEPLDRFQTVWRFR